MTALAPMLTAKELADELKLSTNTLAQWRSRGAGPRYFHMHGSVRYFKTDVEQWINQQLAATN